MEEINYETVRSGMTDTNPAMEALSAVLRGVGHTAVHEVAAFLAAAGVDPGTMPGEYFIQAMLTEADKVFSPVDPANWGRIHEAYTQVNAVLAANPELRQVRAEALAKASAVPADEMTEDQVNALAEDILRRMYETGPEL